jgi:UTP--glucose-1-phosphate uridylyltransferase
MREPGFTRSLREELTQVLPEFQERVHRAGALTDDELIRMTTRQDADPAMYHPDHPDDKSIHRWDDVNPVDELLGEEMIMRGEVAFVMLAGGVGTRMGGPKIFAKIPEVNTSLLAWKVMQGGGVPTWIMTSVGNMNSVAHHMQKLVLPPKTSYHIFEQFEGYRLTPDNRLSWVTPGVPDLYPLGHGDVGPALVESGVLRDNPEVKYAYICNVDNVLASPHEGLLGFHKRQGADVTCEVVDRQPGDKGGVVAVVNDRLQVAEDWRLPHGFADQAKWHNTNTMIVDIGVLAAQIEWRWHRIRKQVNDRLVIQHERLLQQYTEEMSTNYVHVPREARYQPIKTPEDLEAAGKLLAGYKYT